MRNSATNFFLTLNKGAHFPAIHFSDKLLFMGSCFAEHIGQHLEELYFSSAINPTGIIFNPSTLLSHIQMALCSSPPQDAHIVQQNHILLSLDFYSRLYAKDKNTLTDQILSDILTLKHHLLTSRFIFVSLGTAWVYRYKKTQQIIANCQKQPQHNFDKILLSENEIIEALKASFSLLMQHNRDIQIILTVSPVRHIKNGLHENNVSKGRLLSACYELTSNHNNIHYFPSYEIIMDVLRDYRFYSRDKIHPSAEAVDIVFDHVMDSFFDEETQRFTNDLQKLKLLRHHRPRFEDELTLTYHQEQIESLSAKLIDKYPILLDRGLRPVS